MTHPTFICIGAQRAGTTWLSRRLSCHPEVFVSEPKELQFFNAHYDRGMEWYEAHFAAADEPVRGELTPNYLHITEALERIRENYPSMKIIVILRQPMDRTISAWHLYEHTRFKGMSLTESCRKGAYLIGQSLYADRLNDLFSLFPREQILIKLYNELERAPRQFLTSIYDFLNVSRDHESSAQELNQKVNKALLQSTQLRLKRAGLSFLVEWVKTSPLDQPLRTLLEKRAKKPRSELLSEYAAMFLDDIEATEALTGLQLETWKADILKHCRQC